MKEIYLTINTLTGKFYIGQCVIRKKLYKGSGVHISRAIEKYGIENFMCMTLRYVEDKDADFWEQYFIKFYDAINIGYNISEGGMGPTYARGTSPRKYTPLSEETKKKISKSKIGNIPWNKGLTKDIDERIAKYGINVSKSKRGKKVSIETRERMSKSQKIAQNRPDILLKKSNSHKGQIPWNKGIKYGKYKPRKTSITGDN